MEDSWEPAEELYAAKAAEDAVWAIMEAEASARTDRRQRLRHPKMKVDGAGLKTVALNRRYNYEAPSKRT